MARGCGNLLWIWLLNNREIKISIPRQLWLLVIRDYCTEFATWYQNISYEIWYQNLDPSQWVQNYIRKDRNVNLVYPQGPETRVALFMVEVNDGEYTCIYLCLSVWVDKRCLSCSVLYSHWWQIFQLCFIFLECSILEIEYYLPKHACKMHYFQCTNMEYRTPDDHKCRRSPAFQ